MKKTNLLALLLSVASALGALTSCNTGGSSDLVTRQTLSNFINLTNDYTTGQQVAITPIGYVIELNLTKQTANITIESLKLPNGTSFGQLVFANLPFTYDTSGWIKIDQAVASPVTSAGLTAPLFSSLKIHLLDRVLNSNLYYPLFDISYSVDGYTIKSIPPSVINQGTTVVSTPGQPDYNPGEEANTLYGISLDPKTMKASITIQGAKFASAMPALNMGFKEIPYVYNPSGSVTLKADALEPVLISGNSTTPMPNYPITNLTCTTDDMNNMNLRFTCTVKSDRNGVVTETPYEVVVNSSTPTASNNQ